MKRRLIIKLILVLLLSVILSLGVDIAYRRVYGIKYPWPANLWIKPEIETKYEIVKVGNSHADDGLNFSHYQMITLGLSSVAQSFDFDLANLKMFERQIKPGALIIINVSPISFSQKKSGKEDALQYKYYDGRLSPFLIPNLKVEDYLQSQIFPFLRAGYLWREKNSRLIGERIAAEQRYVEPTPTPSPAGAKPTPTPTPQWILRVKPENYYFNVEAITHELNLPTAIDKERFGDSSRFMANKWMSEEGYGIKYFETNRGDLDKLIAYCQKQKWQPVLISIPISQLLVDALPANYMQTYLYNNLAKADLQGVDYMDFNTDSRLTTNLFLYSNTDHLNSRGGAIFSYLLMQQLIEKRYLTKTADGYDYGPLYVRAD